MQVNIYEAKTRLSELVAQAHKGETVIIAKAGTPMAKLVPLDAGPKRRIKFGLMKAKLAWASSRLTWTCCRSACAIQPCCRCP